MPLVRVGARESGCNPPGSAGHRRSGPFPPLLKDPQALSPEARGAAKSDPRARGQGQAAPEVPERSGGYSEGEAKEKAGWPRFAQWSPVHESPARVRDARGRIETR